jgi:hypothetical protein
MLKKRIHNHNNNQTNPKPQPKQKTKPKTQPPSKLVHTKHPQQQPKQKHRKQQLMSSKTIKLIIALMRLNKIFDYFCVQDNQERAKRPLAKMPLCS